jgi:hypothetical protein
VGASIKGYWRHLPNGPPWLSGTRVAATPSARIEILEICPAAKVHRRSSTTGQNQNFLYYQPP